MNNYQVLSTLFDVYFIYDLFLTEGAIKCYSVVQARENQSSNFICLGFHESVY